jgi:hypothetical protein
MVKMNSQTKIIVFTAISLTAVDLSVRYWMMQRTPPAAVQGDIITAREIRLVDNDGNLRAHMTTDENGEAGLVLYDRNGVNRAQLDTWQDIPSLILYRPDGQRSTYYGMDTDGKSMLDMYGDSQETLASLNVTGQRPSFFSNDSNVTVSGNTVVFGK